MLTSFCKCCSCCYCVSVGRTHIVSEKHTEISICLRHRRNIFLSRKNIKLFVFGFNKINIAITFTEWVLFLFVYSFISVVLLCFYQIDNKKHQPERENERTNMTNYKTTQNYICSNKKHSIRTGWICPKLIHPNQAKHTQIVSASHSAIFVNKGCDDGKRKREKECHYGI